MKIIITESQYEMLFKELPAFLKRRITPDDFEYFDNNLNKNIHDSLLWSSDFDEFSYNVISQVMHEFVLERKDDEIETEYLEGSHFRVVYNNDSLKEVFDKYWELIPFFEDHYKDKLHKAWYKGKSR